MNVDRILLICQILFVSTQYKHCSSESKNNQMGFNNINWTHQQSAIDNHP